jgi:hypothetical protein
MPLSLEEAAMTITEKYDHPTTEEVCDYEGCDWGESECRMCGKLRPQCSYATLWCQASMTGPAEYIRCENWACCEGCECGEHDPDYYPDDDR